MGSAELESALEAGPVGGAGLWEGQACGRGGAGPFRTFLIDSLELRSGCSELGSLQGW